MNINHFHLVCFSGPSMILDVILSLSNLFIFEIPLNKFLILGRVHAVGEIFIFVCYFILGVVRRGVRGPVRR